MKHRLDTFTILRGMALLFVSLFHIFPHIVNGGYLGVVVFFAMSGFLMMRKFDNMKNPLTQKDVLVSFNTRFHKLLPPLYIAISIALIFSYFFANKLFIDSVGNLLSVVLGYDNISQILKGMSYFDKHGNFYLFTHLWTICVQFQFIIIFIILNYLLSKFKKDAPKIVTFGLLGVISSFIMIYLTINGSDLARVYYATDTRIAPFFFGALAYLIFGKKVDMLKTYNEKLMDITKSIILITILAAFLFVKGEDNLVYIFYIHLFTILVCILLSILYKKEVTEISIIRDDFIGKIEKIFYYLGQRSYHIYIYQYMIGEISRYLFSSIMIDSIYIFLIQIFVTLAISELSYQLFKQKGKAYFPATIFIILSLFLFINYLPVRSISDGEVMAKSIEENQAEIMKKNKDVVMANGVNNDIQSSEEKNLILGNDEKVHSGIKLSNGEIIKFMMQDDENLENNSEILQDTDLIEENQQNLEKISSDPSENSPGQEMPKQIPHDNKYSQEELELLSSISMTCVGDSVIINADSYLRSKIPNLYLDGKVSRQLVTGIDVLQGVKNNVGLGNVILIALGTNGDFDKQKLAKFREIAEDRPIIFVNCVMPDSWEGSVNKKISDYVELDSNSYLVDWYSYAKTRKDIFYSDLTHPKPIGAEEYADLILKKVLQIYGK